MEYLYDSLAAPALIYVKLGLLIAEFIYLRNLRLGETSFGLALAQQLSGGRFDEPLSPTISHDSVCACFRP